MSRSFAHWTLLLAGIVSTTLGCGEADPPARTPVALPVPSVEPIPVQERARYALERLERGPRPTGGLRVPEIHRVNLSLAENDLLSLERETQQLLADPERVRRVTSMARHNADPWHNILRLLLGMKDRPVELVLAWTEGVAREDLELATLRIEAARVLATLRHPRVAAVLLSIFEQSPEDRDLAAVAFGALLEAGGSIRARSLELALAQGAPELWSSVWSRTAGLVPPGESDTGLADALAWWCALAAGSGPRLPAALPLLKSHPWSQARLATDAAVPGRGNLRGVYGPVPSSVSHGSGSFATDLGQESVLPQLTMVYTGKLPAAEARCLLARWGFAAYRAAVQLDLDAASVDEGLYQTARHCMLDPGEEPETPAAVAIANELDRPGPWTGPRVRALRSDVARITSCDDPGIWELLTRVLFEVQPLDIGAPVVGQAYDAMASRPQDLVALVGGALADPDPARAGVARFLIRRARDPAYIDALERHLDGGAPESEIGTIRRTLIFIYARGSGVEPRRFEPFVRRYLGWLERAPAREFAGLAAGLLDLGSVGEAAFVQGLSGPHRRQYLFAWPRDGRLVSLELASAAMAPIDADTPLQEVTRVLILAYSTFPAESAQQLEAMRRRLAPVAKALVAPVLERVMHRAPLRRGG